MVIACANVANLLLVRTEGRQQELAVRAALGAGTRRLVRSLLVESALLGVLGGAIGLGLAYVGLRLVTTFGPPNLPRLSEVTVDVRSLVFSLVISVVSGLLFGAIPALRYGGPGTAAALHSVGRTLTDSRERHHARNTLVVAQVALALVLLVSAGLMVRTFVALRAVEPGFTRPEQLQTFLISTQASLLAEPERVARTYDDITSRLREIPGVLAAGFASSVPMEGRAPNWDAVLAEGQTPPAGETPPFRLFKNASPGYFLAVGTRLLAGRDFAWPDLYDRRPVVILSEGLARELFGTPAGAIGKRVRTLIGSAGWHEVIGVVQDVRENGVAETAPATVYWPTLGDDPYAAGRVRVTRTVTFAVRSDQAGSEALLARIRDAVWSVNGSLAIASPRTMQDLYARSMEQTSFALVMLAIASGMALLLGLVGIYGVIAYSVSQRTREIGIRLALGARQSELRRMFVRHGLRLTAAGVAVGLVAAAVLTRWLSSLLFGVSPVDWMTYGAVPIALAAAAVLASYIPARRAAAVNPVEALKAE
jgi:predicted permease